MLFINVYQVMGNKPVQPVMHNIARDQEQESKNLDTSSNAGEVVNSLIRKGSEEEQKDKACQNKLMRNLKERKQNYSFRYFAIKWTKQKKL